MFRIKAALPLDAFKVRVTFTNGEQRTIDLGPYLRGPIFEPLRDVHAFRGLTVDPLLGTIVWPNGADIDPDVLYHGRTPAAWEQAPRTG